MSLRPRPEIESLETCPHGGLDYAELRRIGIAPGDILDFSVSANPFPPPPGMENILDGVAINRYPDSAATEFRLRLSARLGVAPDSILAGNGAVELIRLIALAYFGRGDRVLVLEPTFGEYRAACHISGAEVVGLRGKEEEGFASPLDEILHFIRWRRPKGVFICNPNNPTGHYRSRPEVEAILDACGDGLLVLDEVYIAFVAKSWASLGLISRGNIIILRSLTKDYALAGLRLGYAVADSEIIAVLRRVQPPWHVNAVAQRAGVIAVESQGYLEQCQREVRQAKAFLTGELARIGLTVLPSSANFFLIRTGSAAAFRAALLQYGILVRDCTSFGLPEYVRIAPRTMPECRRFVAAVEAMKDRGELSKIV